jgi:hypothetical protein
MWFHRRRTADEALEGALGRIYEAQAKQVEALTSFLTAMSELSMKRAASALGARGGRTTAKRKAAAKAVAGVRACPLCRDPMSRNISVEILAEHRKHEVIDEDAPEQHVNGAA